MDIFFQIPQVDLQGSSTWGDTTTKRVSEKVVIQSNELLTQVGYWLALSNGSPTDNLQLDIYEGGTNAEDGTHIGGPYLVPMSELIPVGQFNPHLGTGTPILFSLSSFIPLVAGITYFFTLTRTGPLDDDNTPSIFYATNIFSYSDAWYYRSSWIENVSLEHGLLLYTNKNLFLQTVQMVGADTGDVQTINTGKDDDGTPIYYELNTQEIEFGNRAHLKSISDLVVVLNESGIDSFLEAQEDDGDFKPIPMDLSDSVNIGKNINLDGNFFTFRWSGVATESSPIFQGIYLEGVQDLGIVKN